MRGLCVLVSNIASQIQQCIQSAYLPNRAFLRLLRSTGLPWVKYRLLIIMVEEPNLCKCTHYTKTGSQVIGSLVLFYNGENIRSNYQSSQIKREKVRWPRTSKHSPLDWQPDCCCGHELTKHLQGPQAMQNVNRCQQSAVLSVDLNDIRICSTLLWIQL